MPVAAPPLPPPFPPPNGLVPPKGLLNGTVPPDEPLPPLPCCEMIVTTAGETFAATSTTTPFGSVDVTAGGAADVPDFAPAPACVAVPFCADVPDCADVPFCAGAAG